MPELSPRRRMLVLAICCMSLFIVGLDVTIVNVALPSIKNDLHASVSGLQWTARRVHGGARQPADAVGLDRRPARPAPHVPDRPADLHAGLAAVQPRARARLARRVPDGAGRRWLDAEPGRHVDHHQHVHRAARARPGHRRLGRRGRHQHGARPGDRRRPGRRPSAGARSSGSTSRSASPRSCSARASSPSPRRRGRAGSIRSARCSSIAVLASLTYAIIEGPTGRLRSPRRDRRLFVVLRRRRSIALHRLRAPPGRAARRGPALPQRPVQRRDGHRRLRLRLAGRLPFPEHPLFAGRSGPVRACTPASTRCRWPG